MAQKINEIYQNIASTAPNLVEIFNNKMNTDEIKTAETNLSTIETEIKDLDVEISNVEDQIREKYASK
jgi:predicted  nucleic acid-binding Zn-ribbon protein